MIVVSVETSCLATTSPPFIIFWCIDVQILRAYVVVCGRRAGLMVRALVSRSGSSPARGQCVVQGTLLSQCLSRTLSILMYK